MKQHLNTERRLLVWDLDGTLYNEKLHPDLYVSFYGRAKALAAMELLPFLTFEEARAIGVESYRVHKNGITGFLPYAAQGGWDEADLTRSLYQNYHREAFRILEEEQLPGFITGCHETRQMLETLRPLNHALLTQSHLEEWAIPCLKRMGYLDHFHPEALFGHWEVGGQYKRSSTYPLEAVLAATGTKPHQIVFVEDNLDNMEIAKRLDPRIMTVRVCWGQTAEAPVPDCVDLEVNTPLDLLQQLHSVYSPSINIQKPFRPGFHLG